MICPETAKATHIVGGELRYKCVGLTWYEITLVIRRDCVNGQEEFDDPAEVGVFYGDNQLAWRVGANGVIKLPLIKKNLYLVIFLKLVSLEVKKYVWKKVLIELKFH